MTRALLGIDVGTSSTKVVLTDLIGRRIADRSVPYPTTTSGTGAEQDAAAWWAAVQTTTRAVTADVTVVAVAVTSQAPTLVAVDADGEPTGPALTWLDRRATDEAAEVGRIAPESRNAADPFFGTAKLLWWQRRAPSVLERATAILAANGFIVRRLTGVSSLDETTASLMQGFDESLGDFSAALRAAVPALALLPEIVPASAVVGTVTADAHAVTGIPVGTPVIAGGIDAIGSALEAGALAAGDPLVDMTGFSSVTMLAVPRGTVVPGFIHSRHCVADVDLLITAQVTAGATIDWVNALDPTRDLRDADVLTQRPRPGRVLMVPSLAGERTPSWNIRARGMLDGVDLATDGYDLMLAAMEGNTLALARDLDTLRAHGFPIDSVTSTGGGASSDVWLQIKADVLGVPVRRPALGHGAAHGAALLAGLATGVIASLDDVRPMAREVRREFTPDAERHRAYASVRARFDALSAMNHGA